MHTLIIKNALYQSNKIASHIISEKEAYSIYFQCQQTYIYHFLVNIFSHSIIIIFFWQNLTADFFGKYLIYFLANQI